MINKIAEVFQTTFLKVYRIKRKIECSFSFIVWVNEASLVVILFQLRHGSMVHQDGCMGWQSMKI